MHCAPIMAPADASICMHPQWSQQPLQPPAAPRIQRSNAVFPWNRAEACRALLGSPERAAADAQACAADLVPAPAAAPGASALRELAASGVVAEPAACAQDCEQEMFGGLPGSLPTGQGEWSVQIWPEPPKGISAAAMRVTPL